jgi:hypothetical protein
VWLSPVSHFESPYGLGHRLPETAQFLCRAALVGPGHPAGIQTMRVAREQNLWTPLPAILPPSPRRLLTRSRRRALRHPGPECAGFLRVLCGRVVRSTSHTTNVAMITTAHTLAGLPDEARRGVLDGLTEAELGALEHEWPFGPGLISCRPLATGGRGY